MKYPMLRCQSLPLISFNIHFSFLQLSLVYHFLESCVGIELPLFYFIKSILPVDRIVDIKLYSESLRITYSTGDGIGQTGNLAV